MTPDEINIEIGILTGWKNIKAGKQYGWAFYADSPNPEHGRMRLPNFCGSLDEMHEAEKVMTREQQRIYTKLLHPKYSHNLSADWCILHADSNERAEKFLRTFNKWKEEPK